jgi:SNF2 family DNA or RNA helicase
MIAQPRSGGYGNTWTGASVTYYYSNSLSLEDRLQSEDRTHRGEQKRTCTYTDMLMLDSTDEKIVKALRSNQRVSDYIMGHRDSI